MLGLVGRVAAASASGALRGLSPSAPLPQAQLLLRVAPGALQSGKCLLRQRGVRVCRPMHDLERGGDGCSGLQLHDQARVLQLQGLENRNGAPYGASLGPVPKSGAVWL